MPVDRGNLEVAISSYWEIKEEQARKARAKKAAKAAAKKKAEAILAGAEPDVDVRELAEDVSIAESSEIDGESVDQGDDEDAGTEGSVRGGKQFDPIVSLVANFFRDAGYPDSCIHTASQLELPGFYRPQKKWDVVVTWGTILVAAFELKALGGPSYGNNFNNRVEEAVGSATDVRRAFSEEHRGASPWLGYLYLMEDDAGSRRSVKTAKSPLPVSDTWLDLSYQERGGVFCERLLADHLYDAVCYITAPKGSGSFSEPVPSVGWSAFSEAITGRISTLRSSGIPGPHIPGQASWSEQMALDDLG
ncbi:PaeR7I family type II restriction endonuclease [Streptomyces scabiei]|uniref:PaeR7I family type II restriction endonuclease n=1 Tax=Streptomyces scabiei TaxID=1930 RepID=UPI0029B580F2|nr:PaeR7I family type II restriction endonuclease [Streptomyces scabiei]MDX3117030.1 PaeR7I family type II restriction endonuclease [Streptomyces scabiei]